MNNPNSNHNAAMIFHFLQSVDIAPIISCFRIRHSAYFSSTSHLLLLLSPYP